VEMGEGKRKVIVGSNPPLTKLTININTMTLTPNLSRIDK